MTLTKFIELFPLLDPPLTLTEESVFAFSKKNKLINTETAADYFGRFEDDYVEDDEREYIPCCRLAVSEEFQTLIYWRASAMNYEYFAITVNKKGELIDRKLIGGMVAREDTLLRMVVSIDINFIFFIVVNLAKPETPADLSNAQSYSLEILPDGNFISS